LLVVLLSDKLYRHFHIFVWDVMLLKDLFQIFKFIRPKRVAIFAENLKGRNSAW
jgi:hypothetical protein